MAPHSTILARKIPWTEEPGWLQSRGQTGRLQSAGLQRVRHGGAQCSGSSPGFSAERRRKATLLTQSAVPLGHKRRIWFLHGFL